MLHLVWVKGAFIHVATRLAKPDRTGARQCGRSGTPGGSGEPDRDERRNASPLKFLALDLTWMKEPFIHSEHML
ncbi:hypothetical protein [Lentzea sp. NPDC004782]|uniref:hypothetical protein n=1 Tax=Lentzea sp. NPDC004782 TaxID=3154458 RepID=UPI0033A842DC